MTYLELLHPTDEYNQALQSNVRPIDWINPVPTGRYNLVVIGAGTAGLVTAAGAAGLGANVALVERGLMGGDCLNVGCVPSKAIIAAARQAAAIRDADQYGIQASKPQVDFAEIMQRMRRLRAAISPHDSAKRFSELGIDVFFGLGAFTCSNTVAVGDQTLHFKKAVIATGARAAELPIPGLKEAGYLNNESLFSLTKLPERLIVIGGGPIGCEMAQSFARFGSKVTLIELASRVLAREEPDAALIVQQAMQNDGVELVLGAKILRVERQGEDRVVVVSRDNDERRISGDEILVSVGRTPNLDGLGLETVGVAYHPQQGVEVDDRLRTTNRNIFAAGDVCSKYKFTHAADFLARIVIQNALFMGRSRASKLIIPWCTYTSPEIAHVGVYPSEAAEKAIQMNTFDQPLSNVDRAVLDGETEGFVRVHCRKGSDRIVGATIVAARAGDMIGEIVMAMKHRIGLGKIASVIHPYPTQAEAIRKLGDQFTRTRLTPSVKSLFNTWLRWNR
ncbi:MAG TPA: mercuric reductase [Pirellulaceae bacterium]|nr:mercuric reductase [Pirellulaceae bacterium]HMO94063.1 mercuric reductase [Pirellulaceae bacterium]HMP70931.1 mercuric reductase [Pirellulaceae bacterium]